MKITMYILLSLTLSWAIGVGDNEVNLKNSPKSFIVGGEEVDPACPDCKYPFMVSLQYYDDNGGQHHFCGGSLVDEDWVLTSAHCVAYEEIDGYRVEIGLHDVYDTDGSQIRYVDDVIIHPEYNDWDNDYALLHLDKSISGFQPIQLITDNSHDNEPVMATTMGWGDVYYGGPSSDILLEVEIPIVDNCGNIPDNLITENMICAGDYVYNEYDYGEGSCHGDSGGPLIMTNDDGEYELIGIVSWGYECALPDLPSVFSRIYPELFWFWGYIVDIGDVNFDGMINISDIIIVINFILGELDSFDTVEFIAADMNEDGFINVLDIIEIVNNILLF